eukprot:TRINITY_DN567_c0_g1_i26.p1 TRINITY_DN567_c0_g1~~TRINITY_DN567_c0_g1_i26.p1  ORF type:complete len:173 (+),score=26.81 TRINITY_DN567_c0_g1_i26:48-521(+)
MCIRDSYQYFGIFFAIGAFLTFISLFYIPTIPISPGRFSSLSVMGSLCMLFSLVFLKGFHSCATGLLTSERRIYTLAYCGALVMTFMASMVFRNYLASLLGAIAQLCAVAYLGCSYIPGGITTVNALFRGTTTCIKESVTSLCRCESANSSIHKATY